jgi:ATP synthase proteolipid subunit
MSPEFLTSLGITASILFSFYGAAASSTSAGIYLTRSTCPNLWKDMIPIVISGVLAIYGAIVAVALSFKMQDVVDDTTAGYKYLAAGLSVGLACMWSGLAVAAFLGDSLYGSSNTSIETSDGETSTLNENSKRQNPLLAPLLPSLLSNRTSNGRPGTVSTIPEPTVRFCMVLVYLEAIGLYGFIVALLLIYTRN